MTLVTVRGRKIYSETHGESSGTPLLLVMGMGGSCRGWLPLQVPDFSAVHRTVIFDHRGVGESEDPGGPFTTADLADDIVGLLDALGIEQANVLGIFMGGMACQELALRHPERVNRMILSGTFARIDAKRDLLLQQWCDLARLEPPAVMLVRERLIWTLQDETLEQHDLIDAMVEFFSKGGAPFTPDLFARQCDAVRSHDTADRLRQIPHPTLIVYGRNDSLTPPKLHRFLADEIPNAHLVSLQYGGHLIMAESARAFNKAVLDFLAP